MVTGRSRLIVLAISAAIVASFAIPLPAVATDPTSDAMPPATGDSPRDAPTRESRGAELSGLSAGTSTYTDHEGMLVYRVDSDGSLDEYHYQEDGPITFSIDVDDDYGPTDAQGHPAVGNALYGRTGWLTLRVWDVDDDGPEPEVDEVWMNGVNLGNLTGSNAQWSINTFTFPTSLLRLPSGAFPSGTNTFVIEVDVTDRFWAVEVDWGELRVADGPVPIALLHGYTSDGSELSDFASYMSDLAVLSPDDTATPTVSSVRLEADAEELHPAVQDLLASTGAPSTNIVAHSYGGLVARLYAWDNPALVRSVVMIATPNGGSELADLVCAWKSIPGWLKAGAGWLVDLAANEAGDCNGPENALYQMQTSYVRDVFNAQVPDHDRVEYFTIAGEIEPPLVGDVLLGPDDGNQRVESVRYLSVDHPDHPGKHVPINGVLPVEHAALIHEGSPAMPLVACQLYGEECAEEAAPLQSELGLLLEDAWTPREMESVQIAGGGSQSVGLGFEGANEASIVILSDKLGEIEPTFSGADFSVEQFGNATVLATHVSDPVDGDLTIENTATSTAGVIAIVLVPTTRTMTVDPDESLVGQSEPVSVTVRLAEATALDAPDAEVVGPTGVVTPLTLVETQLGEWTATASSSTPGQHQIVAWVGGSQPRNATALFSVASGTASLVGTYSDSLEFGSGPLADALTVEVDVDVSEAGGYRLSGQLLDASGSQIATAGDIAQLGTGPGTMQLRFEGQTIFASGVDGPYQLADLVLTRDDSTMSLVERTSVLGPTAAYAASDFSHAPVRIDPASYAENAVDENLDGDFDALKVDLGVQLDAGGEYLVRGRLVDANRMHVASYEGVQTLDEGDATIGLSFFGWTIASSHSDGPYQLIDVSVQSIAAPEAFAYLIRPLTTDTYAASDFGDPLTKTARVSVDEEGLAGPLGSHGAAISADGRFVAFTAQSQLASTDTNSAGDVYVHDRYTGTTELISEGTAGSANDFSTFPAISGDGRFVAFHSAATNLVPGDTNGQVDVFLRDRLNATTTRISASTAGVQGNSFSLEPSISGDGRLVAFTSLANNLVPTDTNNATDVFVYDSESLALQRVSISSAGTQASGQSKAASISSDGAVVAFESTAANLVTGDTNGRSDVFVRDLDDAVTGRVSLGVGGVQANHSSNDASISGTGRYVAFSSVATNLVSADTNNRSDVFRYDRVTGDVSRASVGSAGAQGIDVSEAPSISYDGNTVAFQSTASNLVTADYNNSIDIFVRAIDVGETTRASVSYQGAEGTWASTTPAISGDGRHVAYQSGASNLVPDDDNGATDIFASPTVPME